MPGKKQDGSGSLSGAIGLAALGIVVLVGLGSLVSLLASHYRRTCPRCGSTRFRPSEKRPGRDEWMAILALSPFRCRGCSFRFYTSRWSGKRTERNS